MKPQAFVLPETPPPPATLPYSHRLTASHRIESSLSKASSTLDFSWKRPPRRPPNPKHSYCQFFILTCTVFSSPPEPAQSLATSSALTTYFRIPSSSPIATRSHKHQPPSPRLSHTNDPNDPFPLLPKIFPHVLICGVNPSLVYSEIDGLARGFWIAFLFPWWWRVGRWLLPPLGSHVALAASTTLAEFWPWSPSRRKAFVSVVVGKIDAGGDCWVAVDCPSLKCHATKQRMPWAARKATVVVWSYSYLISY